MSEHEEQAAANNAAVDTTLPADGGLFVEEADVAALGTSGAEADVQASIVDAPSEHTALADAVTEASADTGPIGEVGPVGEQGPSGEPTPEELVAIVRADFTLPEAWTQADVLAWWGVVSQQPYDEDHPLVVQNDAGVFLIDPTRANRAPAEWSEAELLAFASAQLQDADVALNGKVVNELRKRISVPSAWSVKEVLEFYSQGVEPEKTSNGVYKNDISRANRGPSDWTTAELEAWALGEISAVGKTGDGKAALELRTRLSLNAENNSPAAVRAAYVKLQAVAPVATVADVLETPVAEVPEIIASIPKVEGLNAMNVSFIDGTLARYAEAVALNKPCTPEQGLKAQTALENLFSYAIAQEPVPMVASLKRILAFVGANQDKGQLFHADNVYRFTHLMRTDRNYRERHVNFLELLRVYSAVNKDLRKQADVRRLVREQQADRVEMLVEFFQKHA
jgi:hypothetical protein